MRAAIAGACLVAGAALAADGDATQSFSSPLPIASGATAQFARDQAKITVGVHQQLNWSLVHFWHAAVSATSDGEGRSTLFSGSDLQPGVSAKLGLGFSSAQWFPAAEYSRRGAVYLLEVRCLQAAAAAGELANVDATGGPGESCSEAVGKLGGKLPPSGTGAEETRRYEDLRRALEGLVGQQFDPSKDSELQARTRALDDICQSAKKCTALSVEDARAHYPIAYARIVGDRYSPPLPGFFWGISLNYEPAFNQYEYRPVVDGVTHLGEARSKNLWTHAASLDIPVYVGNFVLGAQLAYTQAVDGEPVEVCETTSDGAFSFRNCSKALLGEPGANDAFRSTLTIAYLPRLRPTKAPLLVGGQLLVRGLWANGSDTYRVALPVYVTLNSAPIANLVAGVQPTLDWAGGTGRSQFSAVMFVGARP